MDLDAAIDAVAREMTEVEASGALRARVLQRIEQERRHPSPAVPRWAWAGAVAAVVLAVASAVWLAGRVPAPRVAQTTVAGQRSGGPSPAPIGAGRQPVQPARVSTETPFPKGGPPAASRAGRAAELRSRGAAVAEAREYMNPVPALAEIQPLVFSAVEPHPLQMAEVEVAALPTMPSIEIPGLGPGPNDIQSADPKKEK